MTGEAVLTSTHNLCFGAKIRKIGIPLHTPVLLYKSGVSGVFYFTDMFLMIHLDLNVLLDARKDDNFKDWRSIILSELETYVAKTRRFVTRSSNQ